MDSLCRQVGIPPYHLDQIVPLLNEASSLILNPEKISTQFHDAAVEIAESMEALTWLLADRDDLFEVFPQFRQRPDPAGFKALEPYEHITPNERDILESIGPTTLHLKTMLFDSFHPPPQASRSELGTAQLCQYCNWPFQRLGKRPNKSELSFLFKSSLVRRFKDPAYLLTIDHWPALHILEERSLRGCEFCLFLREHLLSVVMQQPEGFDEEPVHVWIVFKLEWMLDGGQVESADITLGGPAHDSRKSLYFTIDTKYSGFDRRGPRMIIQG